MKLFLLYLSFCVGISIFHLKGEEIVEDISNDYTVLKHGMFVENELRFANEPVADVNKQIFKFRLVIKHYQIRHLLILRLDLENKMTVKRYFMGESEKYIPEFSGISIIDNVKVEKILNDFSSEDFIYLSSMVDDDRSLLGMTGAMHTLEYYINNNYNVIDMDLFDSSTIKRVLKMLDSVDDKELRSKINSIIKYKSVINMILDSAQMKSIP